MTTHPFSWPEFEAEASDPANHIAFDPAPRQRTRRTGWSPERQRLFIFALSRCGSVARAARSVGLSPRSAYRLCRAPGAEDFVRAWDEAIDEGLARVRADALKDALGGVFVPVYRRGKIVRVEMRQSNRLAIALLRGRPHEFSDDVRRPMQSRREHAADHAEFDAARAALDAEGVNEWDKRKQLDEVHDRIVERIMEKAAAREEPSPGPRIVRL
jgi:hypothetical protein